MRTHACNTYGQWCVWPLTWYMHQEESLQSASTGVSKVWKGWVGILPQPKKTQRKKLALWKDEARKTGSTLAKNSSTLEINESNCTWKTPWKPTRRFFVSLSFFVTRILWPVRLGASKNDVGHLVLQYFSDSHGCHEMEIECPNWWFEPEFEGSKSDIFMVYLCNQQLFFSFGDVFEYPNMVWKTRIFFEFVSKKV